MRMARLALIVKAYEHCIMPSHFFIDGSPLNEEHKDEWGRIRLRSGVIRLFHHLSALFNEQENEDHNKMHEWIDRKRGRKLKEKKIAQGIRG